ncbi:hypothetical protein NIES4075_74330 [Tolypothrix sp. NIES-4075]|uniref:helix-turn-helix domain-containing protein n=1 Tax=Tolypothrix sp. NIES-4075 TaxID=2005459 RepID=UPI000B5C8E5D|nr:helix-turn-helix domain-containing protein [Tolypothrix sp. NIES-4075]GAX46409.1 hypothetical protein NIES4075_74330 [Tolypothrix sp. NIES-4075]
MQLYTTPEASKETGVPEGTIRSWLSRYPGVFQVDVHIIIEDTGRKMWTVAGLELLRSRKTAGENATPGVANFDADDLLEALLEQDSQQLARAYYQMLPLRTLQRIKQMRCNPTAEDRGIVTNSVRSALNAGTSHLLLPTYQPLLLEGEGE